MRWDDGVGVREIVGAVAGASAAAAAAAVDASPPFAAGIGAFGGLAAAFAAGAALSLRRGRAPSSTAPAAPASPPPVAASVEPLPVGVGRELLERLPLGLLLLDAQGRVIFQNSAAEELLDRSALGLRYEAALRFPALVEAIGAALSDQRASELDVSLMGVHDRLIRCLVRPLPPAGAGGGARPAVLVLLEDHTRIAKAEAMRRDFVANASHELKTPLASISGFIETLQGHAKDDPEAAERFLAIMAAQAERMRRLVEDLLSLNRIEINEHVQPREPVDLAAAAREAAAALAPVAQREGARIEVALPADGPVVRGDADEIGQVLVNLIDNAIKYGGAAGPIRVALSEDAERRPGMVGVSVADCGPGIAREHLPRLTERFYRVSAARSRERGGTGLGLAIAKHIMNRHRGDLAIASVVGEGSRFTAWFPLLAVERRAPPPAA